MTLFTDLAPRIMKDLIRDFDLDVAGAAAILGNLGHESAGFKFLQEIHPVGGGQGGYGWAQWTGPRRTSYLTYCRTKGLDPTSYAANYGFLGYELRGSESKAIPAVKAAPDLNRKVIAFEMAFERAGVKNYSSREAWANTAIKAYYAIAPKADAPTPSDPPAGEVAANPPASGTTPDAAVNKTLKPTASGSISKTADKVAIGGAAAAMTALTANNAGLSWGWIAIVAVAVLIVGAVIYVARKG